MFLFGIYPGGALGTDSGMSSGPPDDPAKVKAALAALQGDARQFLVRAYERFSDAETPSRWPGPSPMGFEQYLTDGRKLDLVLMFQSARGDIAAYGEWVRAMIRKHAQSLYAVQVTEEANFINGPDCIDGPWPNVREGLVQGVKAAKEEARRLGIDVKVGFNSTPTFGPSAEFWTGIGAIGGRDFVDALDYVGLDFFPDVFRPAEDVREAALTVIETMRQVWLPAAGISDAAPIHITEHGWPTGRARSCERQCEVIETVIRMLFEARERLNIERYTMFDLRDADSTKPEFENDIFYHFGLMRDDYTPKPAFETYRRLIAELG